MQTSGMVAFRATIMIVCMVALPLVAVLGTALTKGVQSAIRGEMKPAPSTPLDSGPTPAPETETAQDGDDLRFAETADVPLVESLPRARITAVRPVLDETPRIAPSEPPGRAKRRVPESTASLWSRETRPAVSGQGSSALERKSQKRQGAERSTEPAPASRGGSTLRATKYSTPILSETDDPFSRSERRLREFGAISYRLETWGVTGELYRFSCKVALANQGQAARHFEATETSPVKVIEAVLEQVEAWHAVRR